jgi:hypothetical protein
MVPTDVVVEATHQVGPHFQVLAESDFRLPPLLVSDPYRHPHPLCPLSSTKL